MLQIPDLSLWKGSNYHATLCITLLWYLLLTSTHVWVHNCNLCMETSTVTSTCKYYGHNSKYHCFSDNHAWQFPPAWQFFNIMVMWHFPPSMRIYLASFPGLPTIQFLITCCMRNGRRRPQACSFDGRPLPSPSVCRHWCVKIYQAFPLRFAYCKRSKAWIGSTKVTNEQKKLK